MSNVSSTRKVLLPYLSTVQDSAGNVTKSVGAWLPSFQSYRNGSSDPKYKEKIAQGLNATGALTGQRDSLEDTSNGVFVLTDRNAAGKITQQLTFSGIASSPSLANPVGNFTAANNSALKIGLKRLGDRRTSFQGGIFLGELGESLRMLRSPAKALFQGVTDFVNVGTKRARSAQKRSTKNKILADSWLEYSFGWIPLISDIAQASDAYAKHVNKVKTSRLTSRGSSSSADFLEVKNSGGNVNSVPIIQSLTRTSTYDVQYIIGLRTATTGAKPDSDLLERAGFTFAQFVPTVWELLPWSFLVDYFTNIGDVLNANAVCQSDVAWVCKTERATCRMTKLDEPDFKQSNATRTISGTASSWTTVRKTVQRSASSFLKVPSFRVELPGRPTQWLNMAALALSTRTAQFHLGG